VNYLNATLDKKRKVMQRLKEVEPYLIEFAKDMKAKFNSEVLEIVGPDKECKIL
jgi:hypothetical protein